MDIEKIKKSYEWDPSFGDYSKSHVSYEKRILDKKKKRRTVYVLSAVLILIIVVTVLFVKFL